MSERLELEFSSLETAFDVLSDCDIAFTKEEKEKVLGILQGAYKTLAHKNQHVCWECNNRIASITCQYH